MIEKLSGVASQEMGRSDASICPVCGNATNRKLRAHLAPFIAERAGVVGDAYTHYCAHCEHVYFSPFYTNEQISLIYSGYRGDEYNAQRDKHEPGYLGIVPDLANPASSGYQIRRDYYSVFLSRWRDFEGVVVDYGGGDGYFSRFVFRNAEVVVVDEDYERRGGDLDSLLLRTDFLFATHVFEHLPQPLKSLSRLTERLRPGIPVYIELPKTYEGRLSSAYAELERGDELGSPLPWIDISVLHEHLAHFSKTSAQTLMRRASVPCSEFYYHTAKLMGFLGHKVAAE